MQNESQLSKEELQHRATRAEALLKDPLLQEALQNLKLDYYEQWLNSDPKDAVGREALFMAARAATYVDTHLRIVAGRRPIDKETAKPLMKQELSRRETVRRTGVPAASASAAQSEIEAL